MLEHGRGKKNKIHIHHHHHYAGGVIAAILAIFFGILFWNTEKTKTPLPRQPLYRLGPNAAKNNASNYTRGAFAEKIIASLNEALREHRRFAIICMHHLSVDPPIYRICLMRSNLTNILLVNPQIAEIHGDKTSDYKEYSLGSKEPTVSKRHEDITVEWDDGAGLLIYARMRGAQAANVQMVIDEFTK